MVNICRILRLPTSSVSSLFVALNQLFWVSKVQQRTRRQSTAWSPRFQIPTASRRDPVVTLSGDELGWADCQHDRPLYEFWFKPLSSLLRLGKMADKVPWKPLYTPKSTELALQCSCHGDTPDFTSLTQIAGQMRALTSLSPRQCLKNGTNCRSLSSASGIVSWVWRPRVEEPNQLDPTRAEGEATGGRTWLAADIRRLAAFDCTSWPSGPVFRDGAMSPNRKCHRFGHERTHDRCLGGATESNREKISSGSGRDRRIQTVSSMIS
jgi:hypothetical protein